MKKILLPLTFLLGLLLSCACHRQNEIMPEEVQLSSSGSFLAGHDNNVPRIICLSAAGIERKGLLLASVAHELRALGYETSDRPSEAGYILQITISGQGLWQEEAMRLAVESGYGQKASPTGSGMAGFVADALFVQRHVPDANRPSQKRLKNISNRNAIADSQMRFGILGPPPASDHQPDMPDTFINVLACSLAQAVHEAISTSRKSG